MQYQNFCSGHERDRGGYSLGCLEGDTRMTADPYRRAAKWYDKIFEPMNRGLRFMGLRLHRPRKGMKYLDVGCGTGVHLELYSRFGCEVFGIDPSSAMLQIARSKLGDKAQLHLGDASRMPYDEKTFDLITAMLVLHEMNPQTRASAIGEMKRVLKDEGRLLFIDHHPGPIRSYKGLRARLVVFAAELVAGREHFRNYRNFMRAKGLPTIALEHGLATEKQRVVGEGVLALLLLKKE